MRRQMLSYSKLQIRTWNNIHSFPCGSSKLHMELMLPITYYESNTDLMTDSLHIFKPTGNTICIRKLLWFIGICIIRAAQNLQPRLFTARKTVLV